MNCPTCGTSLGPILEGSYSHYPPARFCDKCVKFIEVPKEEQAVRPAEGEKKS
jgi:hypothetical protein